MSNNNCVVFVTHKINVETFTYLTFLKREIENLMDLLVLYDTSVHPINPKDYPGFKFYFFNSNKLHDFFCHQDKLLPNTLIPLLKCIRKYKYDHYLLMENDIVLNGDFSAFVKKLNEEDCVDYIHIASDVMGGVKEHWPIKFIKNNPFEHLYFAWCQLFYASFNFLLEVDSFMKSNNSIHSEFLLPTLAYNKRNFVIKQFENYGYNFQLSWGPSEIYESQYKHNRRINTFYHPIKNLEIVDWWFGIKT